MHEFSESETRFDTFHGTNGNKDVQMMNQRERFAYMKTDEYELAVLRNID
jgi:serine protease inhibitor